MSLAGAGAYFFGCAGTTLTDAERRFFTEADPLGFILFAHNIRTPDQLRRLTGDLRACLGRDAPILIDQEGGRVQRMGPPHWRQWLPPLDEVRAAGPRAGDVLRLRYQLIAAELRAVGIDVNCAPCADIARDVTHPVLRNRCLGEDAQTVAEMARAVAAGLLAGGVLPVIKHMPGHGAATVDSHLALPRVDLPRDALEQADFAPFRALADLPLAMTAHVVYAAIDAEDPATTSPAMIDLLRGGIGFDGFLMSDDISMQALAGDMATRCAATLRAGCDAVLHCNGDLAEMQMVAATCGTLSDRAQARAAAALALCGAPAGDIAALTADWDALMRDRADA
ncbi:beta-N-acetylhexosaminidase [Actibacterium sp. D379-3]